MNLNPILVPAAGYLHPPGTDQYCDEYQQANSGALTDTLTTDSLAISAASEAYRDAPAPTGAAPTTSSSALGCGAAEQLSLVPVEVPFVGDPESAAGLPQGSSPTVETDTMTNLSMPPPGEVGHFLREQDRLLPVSNVAKIMSRELRHLPHAKISKEAKNFVQECATEWICFIMSEADDLALKAKRKAVSGTDVIDACGRLDMQEWVAPLTNALPFLQPPKRQRNKQDAEAVQPARRRRRRVSDEEAEQVRRRNEEDL